MKHNPDPLEWLAVKALFVAYDHDKQVAMIRDLMDVARVDSIIRNNQPVRICGVDMTAPANETEEQATDRMYRQDFDEWIYRFLNGFCIVVEKQYLDDCFELFQLIVSLSKGSSHLQFRGEEGCIGLYVCDHLEYGGAFESEAARCAYAHSGILAAAIDECVIFSTVKTGKSYLWKMSFEDLFVGLHNYGLDVYIILFLFGFFDRDEVRITDAINRMKVHLFPNLDGPALRAACFAINLYGGTKTDDAVWTKLHNMFPGLNVSPVDPDG